MVRFSRYAPPVEFKPGSARAAKLTQSPQRGQALFLIQDKPATIFTIAKTGAMLFVGQICSRETTALAVEPSCGSDSKSRATLRSSTSLGKTLQACRETQGEFQGHTITPLGVTGASYAHRFPLSYKPLLSPWREAESMPRVAYPGSRGYCRPRQGGQQRPFIRSITHAPDQTGSQPQRLHCVFDLAAPGCSPLCLGSNRFS